MAISTQTQNLNLIPGKSAPVVVHLSQGNVGNTVQFYLYDGDNPYYPTNVSIAVHGVRADGSVFGPYAVSVTSGSNLVSFTIVTAMTSVNGAAVGELVITDSNENQVGSANFGMLVEETPYSSSVTYEDDLSIYQRILAYVQSIPGELSGQIAAEAATRSAEDASIKSEINSIKNVVGGPLVASTVAGMTDKTRVYVYTGSESGYNSGHWYYWNGTAWADGGVYQSAGIETDTELATWDMVADAKAAGNGIKLLADGYENVFFDIIKNSYPRNDGSFNNYNNWDRSNLFAVEPDETIYINALSNTNNNVWYKADQTPIDSGVQLSLTAGLNTVRVPSTAYFLCISASHNAFISNVYRKAKKLAMKSELSTVESHIDQLSNGYENVKFDTVYGSYPTADGAFRPYANWTRSELIPVVPSEKLYFNVPARTTNNVWYDANQNPINSADRQFYIDASNPCVIYVPREARYMCISASTSNWFTGVYRDVTGLMTDDDEIDRNKLVTGMSYGSYELEPGFAEKGAAFLSAMHGGITLDANGANKFSHCPSLKLYNGFAYCVYQTDDVVAQEDAPTTKIQLAKINLTNMAVTYKDIAGRDVSSDMTFSGRCANPVSYLDETNGLLYILFNGVVNNVVTSCVVTYSLSTDAFTTAIMTLVSTNIIAGTVSVPFTRDTFARYISDFHGVKDPVYEFVWSEPITDGTTYYLALSSGGYKLGKTCLFSTTDFQTMTFVRTLPSVCDADCECELAYFKNVIFGASRHRYSDCTLSVWKFDLATQKITDWIQIPDATMRPTWYIANNNLYLVHGLLHRYVLECLWVCYPDQLANSWHEFAIYVPETCQYNSFATNGSDLYCALMTMYKSENERYSSPQIRFFKVA